MRYTTTAFFGAVGTLDSHRGFECLNTIDRAGFYVADELFFSGTAAEITPIRSVDHITVGSGGRGEITARIQKAFFEITKGERPAPGDWLTYVNEKKTEMPADVTALSSQDRSDSAREDTQPVMTYQAAGAEVFNLAEPEAAAPPPK